MNGQRSRETTGVAFLLTQVGAHAGAMFAERLRGMDLTPPQAGLLRALAANEAISQQALGTLLGVFPSRLVALLDELEGRQLVERRDSPDDRRVYHVFLTAKGRQALESIGRVGRAHQEALCASLDAGERQTLAALLARIAQEQGLTPGVHPGFREPRGPRAARPTVDERRRR